MTNIVVVAIGIIFGLIIFWKFPRLSSSSGASRSFSERISVIIPTRNEEQNIACLLESLNSQDMELHEIICVDDQSGDETVAIASSFGAKVLSVEESPEDWTGKSWACQLGADRA